jgi:hypothetical protein
MLVTEPAGCRRVDGDDMLSRVEYFRDLIEDCQTALRQAGVDERDEATVIAALVQSDSYNGLRKALLQRAASSSTSV